MIRRIATADTMARRIERAAIDAIPKWEVQGRAWYPRARDLAWSVADRTGCPPHLVAGALAALSPQVVWSDQCARIEGFVRDALAYVECPSHPGFASNRRRAALIVRGADPEVALSGPKVRAFYRAIQGDLDAVVVDRHALAIALGRPRKSLPARLRKDVVEAYRRAAERVGWHPRDLQALVWVAHKAQGAAA